MTELAIILGLIAAGIAAFFGVRRAGEKAGRADAQAEADRQTIKAQERGRDAVSAARRDDRSNADRVRENDAKW